MSRDLDASKRHAHLDQRLVHGLGALEHIHRDKGVTTAMTATKPPASLKPNHMMARNTMRIVGIVSIKGINASSERSKMRLSPIAKPIPTAGDHRCAECNKDSSQRDPDVEVG